ncbi:T9SS type A sorting domain-containing protein [Bacteroidota bacterium]
MRTDFYFKALYIVLIFISINAKTQNASEVSATFIGSHGYLIESSTKKVMLDAVIYWEGDNWGYIKPPVEIKEDIEKANRPFHSIDLIMVSHAHTDHYNPGMLEKCMLQHEDATLIVTDEVYNAIKAEVDSLSLYNNRIFVPELSFYNTLDTTINDIPLTITPIPHGAENMELFVYSFILDSMRFLQLNSWNSITSEMYDTLGFNRARADVCILGYDYIMNDSKLEKFQNKINPRFSTISHVDGATTSKINNIKNKVNSLKAEYPMNFFHVPMEEQKFTKVGDTILIDTLNIAPSIFQTIPDTTIYLNESFNFQLIPTNYTDKDGDDYYLTAHEKGKEELPSWLNYDYVEMIFSGKPTKEGIYSIQINVIDDHKTQVSDVFMITVIDESLGIKKNIKRDINLYPNPASNTLHISCNKMINMNYYEIFDLNSRLVKNGNIKNLTIDISDLKKGLYNLTLNNNGKIINKKFLVE